MDEFFSKTKCDRCGGSLEQGRVMSMFNEDCICMVCKDKERQHPNYEVALKAEQEEIRKGNLNFKGIGLNKSD